MGERWTIEGYWGGKDGESREQTLHKLHVIFIFFSVCTWICLYLWDEGINVCFDASGFVYVTCQGKVCVGDWSAPQVSLMGMTLPSAFPNLLCGQVCIVVLFF